MIDGLQLYSIYKASKEDPYILSVAHASELSHQDVDIRHRLMDAFLAVR